jgi:hypothetical protein
MSLSQFQQIPSPESFLTAEYLQRLPRAKARRPSPLEIEATQLAGDIHHFSN